MANRVPPAVVFDCDGVLVNTQGVWDRAYAAIFHRYGAVLTPADRRRLAGLNLQHLGHALAELLGSPQPPVSLADEILALVTDNLGTAIIPIPGAVELVEALAGTRPLGVASNTPITVVRSHLSRIGLVDAFDTIVSADQVDAAKPAPDVYLRACERLKQAPGHAIAIEDSQVGIDSARAAGLFTIAAPSNGDLIADAAFATMRDRGLWHVLQAADQPMAQNGSAA